MTAALRAPFPWFGGKRLVASAVWERFGDVPNYVEPFFGSGAVMLGRPTPPRVETVNDRDALLSNFWRAVQADPEAVARWADWPVSEPDLHARHLFLVNRREWVESMLTDPEFFDARLAGWWVWGLCSWIGTGWCAPIVANREAAGRRDPGQIHRKHPDLRQHVGQTGTGASGRGIHGQASPRRQLPDLQADSSAAGRGVLASAGPHRKRPRLQDGEGGAGVHRKRPALTDRGGVQSLGRGVSPHLSGSQGITRQVPHLSGSQETRTAWLLGLFGDLSDRLRNVRIVAGDWSRVLGPTPTWKTGLTGIFLDPPYSLDEREAGIYAQDDEAGLADRVRAWAIEHGSNPLLRIALCGYDTEHGATMPADWTALRWKAHGGYGSQARAVTRGSANSRREVVWFSPHCLPVGLFDEHVYSLGVADPTTTDAAAAAAS